MQENRLVLITGATSGIGAATARLLARHGFRLILCGRRAHRLENLQEELGGLTPLKTLCFDITRREEVEAAYNSLPPEWQKVDVLINNAGNAHGLDLIHQGQWADWEAMIDLNLKGLLYITRLVVPGMVERGRGHVINLGSIAGQDPYPGGNVYGATKAAVDMLTRGMRMDLYDKGVKVSVIQPGMVKTEFSLVRFKGDEARARAVYEGCDPLLPEDVADLILYMLQAPDRVNLAEVLILPKTQASVRLIAKR
ncbi:MAG: SDR family NAD(P)-dependent oxidoreductase [Flavobacteriales bacterium]|nr:SDR family NAD(P)-dependent oxidoreductase [Flavobacteriales bacterium]MCX7768866.1 SDR family NAD(P)-dependent oxidoreductase [Flavobacteriales bacterium]MDW8411034.1 SDR family NAD(P)-dependent oxidoreductase [Flavobacteriales bacterium]